MKYQKHNFSVELIGARYGDMWSGVLGWQEIHIILKDNESLERRVKAILKPDFDGDGKLTPDCFIKITLIKFNRRTVRYFDISLFKSLSAYIGDMELAELKG